MQNTKNSSCNYQECGFNYTLSLIAGKYKMSVLYCLYKDSIVRYNELNRILSPISPLFSGWNCAAKTLPFDSAAANSIIYVHLAAVTEGSSGRA